MQVRRNGEVNGGVVLEKGQRWNMAESQMRIYRVGIHLVEFRMFKLTQGSRRAKAARSSLETVAVVRDYLKEQRAVLEVT